MGGGAAGSTPTTIIPPTLRGRGEHTPRQGCGVRGAVGGEETRVVFLTREGEDQDMGSFVGTCIDT